MKTIRLLFALLALATVATAQETDVTKLTLAREVIAVMKVDRIFDGMTAQMKQGALQVAPLPADATPAQKAKLEAYLDKVMDLSMSSVRAMLAQMDQVYADIYSEAELKAILAFFNSPEGQSMMAKQPQIMQRVMPMAEAMQRDLIPKIQQLAENLKTELAATTQAQTVAEPAAAPSPTP